LIFKILPLAQVKIPKFWGHTKFFKDELQEKKYQGLRQHERTGRSLGSDLRIDKFEVLLGKQLRNKRPDG